MALGENETWWVELQNALAKSKNRRIIPKSAVNLCGCHLVQLFINLFFSNLTRKFTRNDFTDTYLISKDKISSIYIHYFFWISKISFDYISRYSLPNMTRSRYHPPLILNDWLHKSSSTQEHLVYSNNQRI
jgi:hypothetical protein